MKGPFDPNRGVIRDGESYTFSAFKARLEIGDVTFRNYLASGLKTRRPGKQGYVVGSDFNIWVRSQDDCERDDPPAT